MGIPTSDLTQATLANYLHIKQNTYSQYENGHRQIPLELLVASAEFYGTSLDYIVGLTDVKNHIPKNKDTNLVKPKFVPLFFIT